MGHNYAIEKEPKNYINGLIVDTEVAIRQLDPKCKTVYKDRNTNFTAVRTLPPSRPILFYPRQYDVFRLVIPD